MIFFFKKNAVLNALANLFNIYDSYLQKCMQMYVKVLDRFYDFDKFVIMISRLGYFFQYAYIVLLTFNHTSSLIFFQQKSLPEGLLLVRIEFLGSTCFKKDIVILCLYKHFGQIVHYTFDCDQSHFVCLKHF